MELACSTKGSLLGNVKTEEVCQSLETHLWSSTQAFALSFEQDFLDASQSLACC
jgi:hypothetical protein